VIVRRIERHSRLPAGLPTACYERHRPEATLLYELVDQHYPAFEEQVGLGLVRGTAAKMAALFTMLTLFASA